jgi:hypothetical protein
MRDNLIFTGIAEVNGENPEEVIKTFIQQEINLQQDFKFERVHRIGRKQNNKIRPIVAKFSFYKDKETVRRAAPRALVNKRFGVNEQFPKEINDRRKALYPHLKAAKRQGHRVTMSVDRLYIDGTEFIPPELQVKPQRPSIATPLPGTSHSSN